MRRFPLYIILIITIFCLSACKPGVPSRVISPSDMEEILYDFHIAQAMAETETDSVNFKRYSYTNAVFQKHGITEAEFDSSMIWYSTHATYLQDIYKSLRERYSASVAALGAVVGGNDVFSNLDEHGDTTNIWHERAFKTLKAREPENRQSFLLTVDSTFRAGDSFVWDFNAIFITESKKRDDVYVALFVKYSNDSVSGNTQRVYSNSKVRLKINSDKHYLPKQIGGFVYYKIKPDDKGFKMFLMDDIRLIRIHSAEKSNLIKPVSTDSIVVNSQTDTTMVDNKKKLSFRDRNNNRKE